MENVDDAVTQYSIESMDAAGTQYDAAKVDDDKPHGWVQAVLCVQEGPIQKE